MPRYNIVYAPITKDHLRTIDPRYYSLIRTTIENQLLYEPAAITRNRKPLKRTVFFAATWEIRFGPDNQFRVYYDIDMERELVAILAIGIKRGNSVCIGGEEFVL